ncbi:MAG: Ppx/GppA phosphatase, partial [Armatimonadetes bacterium OLB18]
MPLDPKALPSRSISGEDEARLGFESVSADPRWAGDRRITILDPGGHSTEIVTSERKAAGWSKKFESSFA